MFNMSNNPTYFSAGLTLIEVLVVVAIIAILSAIAAPSFLPATQKFRVLGEASSLLNTITFTRSEAIKRGIPITMCASANGASCLSSNEWHKGWIVFTDEDGDQTVGTILKVQPSIKGSDTITPDSAISSVSFNRDGFAMNLPVSVLTFAIHTSPANSNATQCVVIKKTGRLQLQPPGSENCR